MDHTYHAVDVRSRDIALQGESYLWYFRRRKIRTHVSLYFPVRNIDRMDIHGTYNKQILEIFEIYTNNNRHSRLYPTRIEMHPTRSFHEYRLWTIEWFQIRRQTTYLLSYLISRGIKAARDFLMTKQLRIFFDRLSASSDIISETEIREHKTIYNRK